MSLEKQIYVPTVKWHQSKDYVYLIFEVHNSINENIKISENSIYFNVSSGNNIYEMNFELFENIEKENSNYNITEKCIKITLKKSLSNNWTFLTKNRYIYKNNIKINWSEWVNESDDEEDDQNDQSQFDFQKMMQSMGGMGSMDQMMQNMGGMGGMDEMMQNNEDDNENDNEDDNEEDEDIENEINKLDDNNNEEEECKCCSENEEHQ
jgi:hypothetical protein